MIKGGRSSSSSSFPKSHLDESQHLVLDYGGWVGLGGDDLHQHAVYEVPVGHQHVEAMAAVLHARL